MPLGDQAERITVETATPVVLLVRNAFDPNWKAEVDGHPSTVLRADYFLQAVPVPPGRHVLLLRYHDPSIGYGLLGSGAALCLAAGAILVSRRRRAPAS